MSYFLKKSIISKISLLNFLQVLPQVSLFLSLSVFPAIKIYITIEVIFGKEFAPLMFAIVSCF